MWPSGPSYHTGFRREHLRPIVPTLVVGTSGSVFSISSATTWASASDHTKTFIKGPAIVNTNLFLAYQTPGFWASFTDQASDPGPVSFTQKLEILDGTGASLLAWSWAVTVNSQFNSGTGNYQPNGSVSITGSAPSATTAASFNAIRGSVSGISGDPVWACGGEGIGVYYLNGAFKYQTVV